MLARVAFALSIAFTGAFAPSARPHSAAPLHVVPGDECLEGDSCSVEELAALVAEVKAKAAEIKNLETKLTSLTKDDSDQLKRMLQAEECELNGFDGCSAWYYEK